MGGAVLDDRVNHVFFSEKCTVGCPICGGLINEAFSCHQAAWLRSLRRLDNLRYDEPGHRAVIVVCIDPSDLPSFFTLTVVCQLQAIGMSIVPVYSPLPVDLSVAFEVIGGMLPICGINSVTSTSASVMGLPCASLTVRRTVFWPTLAAFGSINSIFKAV